MDEITLLKQQVADLQYKLDQIVKIDRYLFQRDVEILNGKNFKMGSGGKFGIFGATPVTQRTATGATIGMTQGGNYAVYEDSHFGGDNASSTKYSIHGIVQALKDIGILKI